MKILPQVSILISIDKQNGMIILNEQENNIANWCNSTSFNTAIVRIWHVISASCNGKHFFNNSKGAFNTKQLQCNLQGMCWR